MNNEIMELAKLIKNSNYVVVFTGAGMDTESNVPDFRGKGGWWKNIDPMTVANIDVLYENYSLFHEFYSMRIKLLDNCTPHRGHFILAEWEEQGLIKSIATQNVSRFHALAGSKNISELHGNIRTFKCNNCNEPADKIEFIEKGKCKICGKQTLRPAVTLFGESLPEKDWNIALEEIESSDLLIVIGSSLAVSPVNQMPNIAGGKTVYINDEIKQKVHNFDFIIKGKVGEILEELINYI